MAINDKAKEQKKYQVDEKQIHDWKEKHGIIHEFEVDNKKIYLKKLDRRSVSLALGFVGKDFLNFGETLIENNWLGGMPKEEIFNEPEILLSLCDSLSDIVYAQKAVYVKH